MHIVLMSAQLIHHQHMTDPIIIDDEFELTSEPPETKPRDIQMSDLTQLADSLVSIDDEIKQSEIDLSTLKSKRKTIAEEHLPQLMEQAGISTLTLADGKKIAIQDFVDARIKDPTVAFEWLRETNNESIIKNNITVSLGRGDDELAQQVINTLKQQHDIDADVRIGVHNMTLKAFCKDALENPELAESLPREAFGIYEGKRAKIT